MIAVALTGSHKNLFRIETGVLAVMVAASLKKLAKNPSDENESEKLLNYVDVILGDAKFLGDKELEENAKMIINLFKKQKEERTSDDVILLLNRFKELVWD